MNVGMITPEEWANQYADGRARTMDKHFSHASRLNLTPKSANNVMYDEVYIVTDMRKPRTDMSRYEAVTLDGNLPSGWKTKQGVRVHGVSMTPSEWNTYTRNRVTNVTISDIDWCYEYEGYLIAIEEKHNNKEMSVTQYLTYTHDLPAMIDKPVIPVLINVYDDGHYEVTLMDEHMRGIADYYTRQIATSEKQLRAILTSIIYDYEDAYRQYMMDSKE